MNKNKECKKAVMAEKMYINSIRDRIKRASTYNLEQGKWQSLAPIGYINTRDKNGQANIEVDLERAPLIKLLFEVYASGRFSIKKMTLLAKNMQLYSKKDKIISETCINNMFKNPFYYGAMSVKGQLMPHIYTPIIDKNLFDKVQEVLKNNARPSVK